MKNKSFYLYKVTNLVNTKTYIGVTANPDRRSKEHLSFRKVKGWAPLVNRAIEKYGKANFDFIILCEGSEEYIFDLERKAIDHYKTTVPLGYNIRKGGSGGVGGYKVLSRSNDEPLFIRGFWFPNLRTCADKLQIGKGTALLWKRSKTGGEVINNRKPKSNSWEKPCYVGGYWFPTISHAALSLGISRPTVKKRIVAGYIEQKDNKSSVIGTNHPNAIAVKVDGVTYSSVLEASKLSGYTYRVIQYRIQTKKEGFSLLE